tara:strand:- start:232 stop:1734 length:1503 start_codon:yes stop_codon:yes gene_type:complete
MKKFSILTSLLLILTAIIYFNARTTRILLPRNSSKYADFKRVDLPGDKIKSKVFRKFNFKMKVLCPMMTDDNNRVTNRKTRDSINWKRGCTNHYFEIKAALPGTDEICRTGHTDFFGFIDQKDVHCPRAFSRGYERIYIRIYSKGKNHKVCTRDRKGHCDDGVATSWGSPPQDRNRLKKDLIMPTMKIGTEQDAEDKQVMAYVSQLLARSIELSKRRFGINIQNRIVSAYMRQPDEDRGCGSQSYSPGHNTLNLCISLKRYFRESEGPDTAILHELGHWYHRNYFKHRADRSQSHKSGERTDVSNAFQEGFANFFQATYFRVVEGTDSEVIKLPEIKCPIDVDHSPERCTCSNPKHGFDDEGLVFQFLTYLYFGTNLDEESHFRGGRGPRNRNKLFQVEYFNQPTASFRDMYRLPSAYEFFRNIRSSQQFPKTFVELYEGKGNRLGFLQSFCEKANNYYNRRGEGPMSIAPRSLSVKQSICDHPKVVDFYRKAKERITEF